MTAIFLLVLLIVHMITTLYEKYEEGVSPKVSPSPQLSDRPNRLSSIVWRKRDRISALKQDIEAKFKKSTMNQTFAFPRKEE